MSKDGAHGQHTYEFGEDCGDDGGVDVVDGLGVCQYSCLLWR